MKVSRCLLVFLFFFVACAGESFARGFPRGDMFENADWSSAKRPRVPSDDARGEEMLAPYPNLYNRNADLFDGLPPRAFSVREDMLVATRVPDPYGPLFGSWADRR